MLNWGQEAYKGAQSVSEVTLVLGSNSMALVQDLTLVTLGWDSTLATSQVMPAAARSWRNIFFPRVSGVGQALWTP